MDVMERQKLTEDQIEKLAVEIREFLLEHGMWQDVDIYFNHKRFGCKDPETGSICSWRRISSRRRILNMSIRTISSA